MATISGEAQDIGDGWWVFKLVEKPRASWIDEVLNWDRWIPATLEVVAPH